MKMKWCVTGFLLVVLCAGIQLHAQQSDTNSVESIKAKAEKGDASAQCALGLMYFGGNGVEQNTTEALKWYRKAAERGNVSAQAALGAMYGSGRGGVAVDPVESFKWMQKAATQGHPVAQFFVGQAYEYGVGVAKDEVEAVKWWAKAAEQNNAGAQLNLGMCYANGRGVTTNYVEAMKWYLKAAEQGDAEGQRNLGVFYQDGLGVEKDGAEAVKWYRMSAEQNNAAAQCNLGVCYATGEGVLKDDAEAVKWFRKAADQGLDMAQLKLSMCLFEGDGVAKDYVDAYKWGNLASAQGDEYAKKWLSVIEQRMTSEQIVEAQRLSAAFVPRKETPGSNSISSSPVAADFPIATGTGFFITDDGYLISNYHVVKGATKVRLLTSAGLIDAKVVQVDAANDLALLKANAEGGMKNEETFKPLPIAASRTMNLGGTVATIGFPNIGLQGFSPKLAKGEIASLSGAGDDPRYFQISVPVQPGNSGGALVDERGNVIGIVSAKLDASVALAASGALPENVNYAVKSSLLLSFLESVPAVSAKLKSPVTADRKFEEVVKSAQQAAVLVLVY
jgi:TPR repeat protein